jgi:hypothetical protein
MAHRSTAGWAAISHRRAAARAETVVIVAKGVAAWAANYLGRLRGLMRRVHGVLDKHEANSD